MKTTYIYCSTCKRVHERMPERRFLQLEMETSLEIMRLPTTREMMDLGIPVEFLRMPEDRV